MWVALLVIFLWMFFPTGGPGDSFKKYKAAVHPYSGLDPESWNRFLVQLGNFESELKAQDLDVAASSLYRAIENIRDLGLGLQHSDDSHHQEAINRIADDLGYDGENAINQVAISRGLMFFPKYLNETLKDYPDDSNAFIPSTVRSHGQ